MQTVTEIEGRVMRVQRCEKHGTDFVELFFPTVPGQQGFWGGGQCEECSLDARYERQAQELLERRRGEIIERANDALGKHENEIRTLAEKEISEEVERIRPEYEQWARGKVWERLAGEIESAMLAEIVTNLRKQKAGG